MRFHRLLLPCLALLLCPGLPGQAAHPRDHDIHDADTRAWWHTTEALSGDSMEGRDTGTAAYARAAELVARRFAAAGLQPAGEGGTYLQSVPMHEVDLLPKGTSFTVVRQDGGRVPLSFLQEITAGVSADLPEALHASLIFRGYCGAEAMHEIAGKAVLCFGTQRQGLPGSGERLRNAREGHAAAVITVDDPYFTIEPPRWPYAYARSVTLRRAAGDPPASTGPQPVSLRLSAAAFVRMLQGTGHDATAILKTGGAQERLPSFDLPARLEATFRTASKEIRSPNVLAMLPGTGPALREQVVVVAAHLDGYGFGTPVGGDRLYNGTLDDAAYVALLVQLADDLHAGRLASPQRSILFCAFTGEEKGLLGSSYFVQHPTVPIARLAADINLDQLRPLFPLHFLTALAFHDTTLGPLAAEVGAKQGITLRDDREPERGLLHRADHWPFLKAGVPAIGFVFGFDPGSEAERRYRHWYQVQYHRPQDDLTQPVDFTAARDFNRFFYSLVEAVAATPERPKILPGRSF